MREPSPSMPDWLRHSASSFPGRLAVACGAEKWTFAELDRSVSACARRLAAAGVGPGERVALLARNGASFVQLAHALPRQGATLVPLNTRLSATELSWQISDCRASLLVHDDANAAQAAGLRQHLPYLRCLPAAELTRPPAEGWAPGGERVGLSAVHAIVYTSGTTGRPKGALLTFGNHFWSAAGSALRLGLRAGDRWLACLPLFHVGGLAILLRSVICGIPVVLHERFDPVAANRAIDEEGVTIVSAVATMLRRMLEARGKSPYPPTLRCVLVGGGPLPRELLEACIRHGVPVAQTYGLTEAASQVATLAPEEAPGKLGSAGRPLPFARVRIEDDRGGILPSGEPGEIVVQGPTVTPGYVNRPEESRVVLRNGWLHTGDIGYLDAEGYLHVLDRRQDLIISGGENVYPAEVEAVLRSHPAVLDAAVVGIPDDRWGERASAVVSLRPGERISEKALRAFCEERLARYKVPAQVRFVNDLPRTAAGKLRRRSLRD